MLESGIRQSWLIKDTVEGIEFRDAILNSHFKTNFNHEYWQIKVAEPDRKKTAFSTPMGLFQ
ncbi:hypothetical protein T4B_5623 [Trichinella pseudospiralis]|uniref:Uncharacterized protein n=1 Tax=Trichinella pseudospiralis TaxID=6337 RepID=A0A0V1IZV7_TRIPS|nr:hypothetical protein T4E_11817 [Trichinella pseudospiralis]KRY76709.1 hypothetical protein T4A_3801 [Trichinella pseudospiralis]KRZ19946.1 hypothetical protein T4B_5623 [Trichinella pseudospiralis]KRZ28204.1 hypothetical protein T4C_9634 [Trichinella pseudospiralis]